jgi:hypothetical protein
MPFSTTPILPLTVSVSSPPTSPSLITREPLSKRPDEQHHCDIGPFAPPAPPSAVSDAPSSTFPASKSNPSVRPSSHARRYTSLSRFPLLRKGSRELSRTPSSAKSPAASPFHATGAPRASSSTARASESPPAATHEDADVITEPPKITQRAGKPDKMHQTSSRLLRMTDDERPFTRVSTAIHNMSFLQAEQNPNFCAILRHRTISWTPQSSWSVTRNRL